MVWQLREQFSNYVPARVKTNTKRFPRALSSEHQSLEILSTLSIETPRCDSRAFDALMQHTREKDEARHTVAMPQV